MRQYSQFVFIFEGFVQQISLISTSIIWYISPENSDQHPKILLWKLRTNSLFKNNWLSSCSQQWNQSKSQVQLSSLISWYSESSRISFDFFRCISNWVLRVMINFTLNETHVHLRSFTNPMWRQKKKNTAF